MKKEHNLLIFLMLTFGIALPCTLLRLFCPLFQNGIGNFFLLGIAATSPTIGAILTVGLTNSHGGIKQYLKSAYRHNLSVSYCILAFLIPAFFLTIGKGIIYLSMPVGSGFKLPTMKKAFIILWALVAEELGWRGYLQSALEKCLRNIWIPLVTGIIWSLWHYHFWLIDGMDIPFLIFTYGCIAESYGYYTITRLSKGNIVPASIWHFSSNLFFNLYLINPSWNGGSMVPYLIINSVYTVYILLFFVYKTRLED